MKIEIELEEIEKLKRQINILEQEKRDLKFKVSQLDEEAINKHIIELANLMFNGVMKRLFEEMGLSYNSHPFFSADFSKLEKHIGRDWWTSSELEITIGTSITNKFKNAILRFDKKNNNE